MNPDSELWLRLIIEVGPKVLDTLSGVIETNRALERQLGALEQQIDAMNIKEINSAFELINGLRTVDSAGMRARHLDNAEGMLLKNVGLDRARSTLGKPNAYWVARVYHGLSCLAVMRQENVDMYRFSLRMYEADPRSARDELAPDIFRHIFAAKCEDLYVEHRSEMAHIDAYNARRRTLEKQMTGLHWKQAGVAVIGVVGLFMGRAGAGATRAGGVAHNNIVREKNKVQAQIDAIPSAASITAKLQLGLDARCREMATAMLEAVAD